MDRKQTIIVRRHGSTDFEFFGGPMNPAEAGEKFMTFRLAVGKHPHYAEAFLIDLNVDRHERFVQVDEPKEKKSPMNRIKSLVSLIAFAALALFTPMAEAQNYPLSSIGGSTLNIAATSTNTTMSATNGMTMYFTRAPIYGAFQPTFKLTGSGTSACVFTFDTSVDGTTWKAGTFTITVTAAGTTTVCDVSNQTLGSVGYARLAGVTNPNATAITNLFVYYVGKTP